MLILSTDLDKPLQYAHQDDDEGVDHGGAWYQEVQERGASDRRPEHPANNKQYGVQKRATAQVKPIEHSHLKSSVKTFYSRDLQLIVYILSI